VHRRSIRLGLTFTLAAGLGCNGTWKLAPPPDTGTPIGRPRRPGTDDGATRGHRHVHLPGEVRGQRLYPVFARAVALTVYRHGQWLIDPRDEQAVVEQLVALQPTLVSSLFVFTPDDVPTARHQAFMARVRDALRSRKPDARFDLELDAMAYASGPQVVDHMRLLTEALEPDLWRFTRWGEADRENFAVVASATGQAHANGQAIGGEVAGREIATDSDFGVVYSNAEGRTLLRQLRGLTAYHALPYLIETAESASVPVGPMPPDVRAFVLTRLTPTATPPAPAAPVATPRR
jgi:hypothetical protein